MKYQTFREWREKRESENQINEAGLESLSPEARKSLELLRTEYEQRGRYKQGRSLIQDIKRVQAANNMSLEDAIIFLYRGGAVSMDPESKDKYVIPGPHPTMQHLQQHQRMLNQPKVKPRSQLPSDPNLDNDYW